MAAGRIDAWQSLLRRALEILDSVPRAASWSLGGATVLMLRYQHRLSKDIDIFVPDPQLLGYLSPRLNDKTRALTPDYAEQANFLKLYLAEGEIDFVASGRITAPGARRETILGREMLVETSAEIVAKKIWHRAEHFTARDLVDFATVVKRDRKALSLLKPVIAGSRRALLERLGRHEAALRDGFAALDLLQFSPSFDECLQTVLEIVESAAGDRMEQPRASYGVVKTWSVPGFGAVMPV